MNETRPRSGLLLRADGTSVPIVFVPTGDALVFLAVDRDGNRVTLEHGDAVHVDELGPGQSVVVEAANTWSRS